MQRPQGEGRVREQILTLGPCILKDSWVARGRSWIGRWQNGREKSNKKTTSILAVTDDSGDGLTEGGAGKLGRVNALTYVLEVEWWGLDDASDVGLRRGKGQRVILGFQL